MFKTKKIPSVVKAKGIFPSAWGYRQDPTRLERDRAINRVYMIDGTILSQSLLVKENNETQLYHLLICSKFCRLKNGVKVPITGSRRDVETYPYRFGVTFPKMLDRWFEYTEKTPLINQAIDGYQKLLTSHGPKHLDW